MAAGKVTKIKKRRTINIGAVIFFIIAIYLMIYIFMFVNKPYMSIYEVRRESLSVNSITKGVIIRDEVVVATPKSGQINYYLREGAKVKRHSLICSVNDGSAYRNMPAMANYELTEQDVSQIKKQISDFGASYDDNDYRSVEGFKDDVIGSILQMIDINQMEEFHKFVSENGIEADYYTISSDRSGVITYYLDTYDGMQDKDVSARTFDDDGYASYNVRTKALVEEGGKAYKLVTSEDWKIIAYVDASLHDMLQNISNVKIRILEDDFVLTVPVETYRLGMEYYAKMTLDEYMIRYMHDRFLDIEFMISSEVGLKIPSSAIIEKSFYMIPAYCLTYGGSAGSDRGVVVKTYNDAKRDFDYTFVQTTVYYNDQEYAYVDMANFNHNTFLAIPDGTADVDRDEYRVTLIGKLEGVYNINKGFAVFRRIEKVREGEDYCIIKEGTTNGVALYDHIALDATNAVEEKSIW